MLPILGPGALIVQRTDIANCTPVNIGKVNSFTLARKFAKKDLHGQSQFPLFTGRTTGTITGKLKAALVSGIALASAFYGMTLSAGQQATALSEAGAIPTTPYQVTVANSATFVADLGVIFAATGLPLKFVASGPTTGQYSVAAGVYTFAAADTGKAVLITYTYTVSASGQQMTIGNPLIGVTPYFQLWYYTAVSQPGGAVSYNLQLYSCISDDLSTDFKLEDFMLPELSFSCFANAAGSIGLESYGEVS